MGSRRVREHGRDRGPEPEVRHTERSGPGWHVRAWGELHHAVGPGSMRVACTRGTGRGELARNTRPKQQVKASTVSCPGLVTLSAWRWDRGARHVPPDGVWVESSFWLNDKQEGTIQFTPGCVCQPLGTPV